MRVPVTGMGGIQTAQDAIEFLIAGASAVQVGTATFVNPWAGPEIAEGIADYGRRNGIDRLDALIASLEVPD